MTDKYMELSRRLHAAVDRGESLHPWHGVDHQLHALAEEMLELSNEIKARPVDLDRVLSEAIDVFVCAWRAAQHSGVKHVW